MYFISLLRQYKTDQSVGDFYGYEQNKVMMKYLSTCDAALVFFFFLRDQ